MSHGIDDAFDPVWPRRPATSVSLEQLSALIGEVYDVDAGRSRWESWLDGLANVVHADLAAVGVRAADGTFHLQVASGHAAHLRSEYNAHWCRFDPVLVRQVGTSEPRIFAACMDDFWLRFLGPLGMRAQVVTGPHDGSDMALFTWHAEFCAQAHSAFPTLMHLLPHAAKVMKRQREYVFPVDTTDGAWPMQLLEMWGGPVVLVTSAGRTVFANARSRDLAKKRDGFGLGSDGPLGATATDTQRLRAQIGRAAAGPRGGVHWGHLKRSSGLRDYEVAAQGLGAGGVSGAVTHVALFIRNPEGSAPSAETLQQLHGLTRKQAIACECLVQGRPASAIAAALHVSQQTSKWYVRQLYSKFGVRTHAELVCVVAGGMLMPGWSASTAAGFVELPVC